MGSGASDRQVDILLNSPESTNQLIDALKEGLDAATNGQLDVAFRLVDIVQSTMPVWIPSVASELGWGVDDIVEMSSFLNAIALFPALPMNKAPLVVMLKAVLGHLNSDAEQLGEEEPAPVFKHDVNDATKSWRRPFTNSQVIEKLQGRGLYGAEVNGRPIGIRVSEALSSLKADGVVKNIEPGRWQRL